MNSETNSPIHSQKPLSRINFSGSSVSLDVVEICNLTGYGTHTCCQNMRNLLKECNFSSLCFHIFSREVLLGLKKKKKHTLLSLRKTTLVCTRHFQPLTLHSLLSFQDHFNGTVLSEPLPHTNSHIRQIL